MKKILMSVLVVVATTTTFAKGLADMYKSGRMLMRGGKGAVALFSAQSRFDEAKLKLISDPFYYSALVPVAVSKIDGFKFTGVADTMKKASAQIAVFVVDDPQMPMSLISPEARWGVLNLAPLATDDAELFEERASKMFTRVAGELTGMLAPKSRKSILGAITSVEGLDSIPSAYLTFDLLAAGQHTMPFYGIVPAKRVSYKRACEEGWAPAPLSEEQKMIAEEVKAEMTKEPTEPKKIKFKKNADK